MTYIRQADRPQNAIRHLEGAALMAAISILLLLLSGCAGPIVMTREPDKALACVAIEWATPERIAEVCGSNPLNGLDHLGCYQPNTIITRRPTGWSDEAALLVLGHEFLHALGASHE